MKSSALSRVCIPCGKRSEVRKRLDIKLSSDYPLGDDPVFNGLCFLHACGVLSAFVDSCYSSTDAFYDDAKLSASVTEDAISEHVLDLYDDFADRYFTSRTLKGLN